MPTTARGIPYPSNSDTVDIAGDIQALAEGIDTAIGASTLPLTTKGDLLIRDASAVARLPVGTDGNYLAADSAQTAGLKWASISTGYYSAIASISVTSNTSVVQFLSIPQTFTDLILVASSVYNSSTMPEDIVVKPNGSGSTNYFGYQGSKNSSNQADSQATANGIYLTQTSSRQATWGGAFQVYFLNYSSTTRDKTSTFWTTNPKDTTYDAIVYYGAAVYDTAGTAITSLDIVTNGSLISYGNFALYGIKGS